MEAGALAVRIGAEPVGQAGDTELATVNPAIGVCEQSVDPSFSTLPAVPGALLSLEPLGARHRDRREAPCLPCLSAWCLDFPGGS